MRSGVGEGTLLLLSSSAAAAVTAVMRSAMRALDVIETRLRSLLDSANAVVVATAVAEDRMMRDWTRRADPPNDDASLSGPSSSSVAVIAADIGRREVIVGRREIWGPSRYAFLRDINSATIEKLLKRKLVKQWEYMTQNCLSLPKSIAALTA